MAPHQREFLGDGKQFHPEEAQVGFFDDEFSASLERAPEFVQRSALVNDVVKRVHHDDAGEGLIVEREFFGVRADGAQAILLAGFGVPNR